MNTKQITVRDDEEVLNKFSDACADEGTTMSAEVRKFMRRFNRRVENSRISRITSTTEQEDDLCFKIDIDKLNRND